MKSIFIEGGVRGAWRVLFLTATLFGCDSPTPAGPSGSKFPPVQPPDPPVDRVDAPFDLSNLRGYSAFAIVGRSREDRINLMVEGREHGFPTVRACGETEFWDGAPDDDHPRFVRSLERLRVFLSDATRLAGIQVLLVPNCTLRDAVPVAEQLAWDRGVRELVTAWRFQNVAVEVVNEFWHPDSLIGKVPIVGMISAWNASGVLTGTDDAVCIGDFTLQHRLFGHAAFYSFHPCRETPGPRPQPWDPSVSWLRKLLDANSGSTGRPVILSETVCYADPNDFGGLCTADRERIQAALDAAAAADVGWIYHSREGLGAKPPYSWWPQIGLQNALKSGTVDIGERQ